MNLLDDDSLEQSAVVANCRMNRERVLVGANGYDKELGLNPMTFLRERLASGGQAAWLDLCCGSGKALIEAGRIAQEEGLGPGSRSSASISSGCSSGPSPNWTTCGWWRHR